MATATAPNVYEGQTRGFAVGGRLNIRASSEMVQPFNLKAPSFKAGCNGLDIFAGSFSWINSEQLTKTMRAIGQNAVGYAFSLGLQAVCPMCDGVLKQLQHYMNQINKMSADSCAAAKALVNTGISEMTDGAVGDCVKDKGNSEAGDYVQGWLSCANDEEPNIKSKLRASGYEFYGMKQAAKEERAPKMLGGQAGALQAVQGMELSTGDKELMISILGTYYMTGDTATPGGGVEGGTCKYVVPTVTLTELVDGGLLKIQGCASGAGTLTDDTQPCTDYAPYDKQIEGYKMKVYNKMLVIYNKLIQPSASARELSPADKDFINTVPTYPVFTILNQLAQQGPNNQSGVLNIMYMYAGMIGVEYAQATIERYIYLIETGSKNVTTACMVKDPGFKNTIKTARTKYYEEYKKYRENLVAQKESLDFQAKINQATFIHSKTALTGAILR